MAGEAGVAEAGSGRPGRLLEGIELQVGQAVGAQVVPDLANQEVEVTFDLRGAGSLQMVDFSNVSGADFVRTTESGDSSRP